jgi:hypothetical protein
MAPIRTEGIRTSITIMITSRMRKASGIHTTISKTTKPLTTKATNQTVAMTKR